MRQLVKTEMKLSNKVALITGAATGIGNGIARKFASEGARIIILDLDQSACDQAAAAIASAYSSDAVGIQTDITDEAAVQSAVDTTLQRFGAIDILVSNAGIQIISSLDQLSYADWRKVMAVHLDGAFLVTRACVRHMYASGRGGSLIYMGSIHSKLASVLKAPYIAAKHGILGLCRAMAKEGAPYGVRANVICPGFVRTGLVNAQIPEQARVLGITEEEVISKVMLKDTIDKQFTTVDEVAEAALFLASAEGLALTGQSVNVNHGWFME
jgi:3-hydroxybutyrate dehydrogenase